MNHQQDDALEYFSENFKKSIIELYDLFPCQIFRVIQYHHQIKIAEIIFYDLYYDAGINLSTCY